MVSAPESDPLLVSASASASAAAPPARRGARAAAMTAVAVVGVLALAGARRAAVVSRGGDSGGSAALDAEATKSTCELCDGMSNSACLDILDAKIASMDDLDRLGLEKRILGAGICDQSSLGSAMCLKFLDAKIASMSKGERRQTWELACAWGVFGPSEPPANTTAYSGEKTQPNFNKGGGAAATHNTTELKNSVSSGTTTVRRDESTNSTSHSNATTSDNVDDMLEHMQNHTTARAGAGASDLLVDNI